LRFELDSPAKINLYLRVVRRRPDGYHELDTVFERVSLCDRMTFESAPSGLRVVSSVRSVPSGPGNLAWKAADLLRRECGVQRGAVIRIEKRIPSAAGLGGGSSNAATALVGLNRLWGTRLSKKRLLRLAARVGSDVPFFVLDVPFARGRGRGERLRPLQGPPRPFWHVLVKPRLGIPTRDVYGALPPSALTPSGADAKMLLRSLQKGRPEHLSKLLTNTLEVSRNKRVKSVLKIKEELLRAGALGALLSGSGSTVFGLFASRREAGRAARSLAKNGRRVFVVSTR
jgi:4-diphosphocytidyl-2-C-methyl-D-erythritol kinase